MTGAVARQDAQRDQPFHLMVHEGFVSFTDGEGANEKGRVVNHFQVRFEVRTVSYLIAEAESFLVLNNKGHELALLPGREK